MQIPHKPGGAMSKTRQHLQRQCVSLTQRQVQTLVLLRSASGLSLSELVRRSLDETYQPNLPTKTKPNTTVRSYERR